jgi:hypothetical protein
VLLGIPLVHGYLWWRLVRGTTHAGRARRFLTVLLVVLAILLVVEMLVPFSPVALVPVHWVGFIWMGLGLYTLLALLVLEPARACAGL